MNRNEALDRATKALDEAERLLRLANRESASEWREIAVTWISLAWQSPIDLGAPVLPVESRDWGKTMTRARAVPVKKAPKKVTKK